MQFQPAAPTHGTSVPSSKRRDRDYRGGRCNHWIKIKNPKSPAVKRADWSR
jgi:hypothetical protein